MLDFGMVSVIGTLGFRGLDDIGGRGWHFFYCSQRNFYCSFVRGGGGVLNTRSGFKMRNKLKIINTSPQIISYSCSTICSFSKH